MITRRCSERRFLLRPDKQTVNNFLYCLGYAAERAKVGLTFAVMMGNHHHVGINDHQGNFPVFLERFHSLLARCQNAQLGRFEHFWSSDPTSVVRLVAPEDTLDKLVYAFANPAAADLVETINDWPGAHSLSATLSGGTITATRPEHFFREDGDMPKTVTIPFERPIGYEDLSQRDWALLVTRNLREVEASHRARRRAEGKKVLGKTRILEQHPLDTPSTVAKRFGISPKIAAKNKWARIEAIQRNQGFVDRHRQAFKEFMSGVANIVFPFGTYWWRKFGRMPCEPDPESGLDSAPCFA
jgi:hypothetical protein